MPASLQGESQPTFYRFKLGGFEVATVLDAKAIRDGLHPHYGANASADDVHALARANNIDTQRFEHPNIPTIVNTGKQLILFDTGNGALPREYEQLSKRLPPGQTAERLAAAGYKPEDIDVVVLTHGHPDHIGGLTEGGKPVFPKARYVFGAAEFDFWKRGENVREARKFNRELYVAYKTRVKCFVKLLLEFYANARRRISSFANGSCFGVVCRQQKITRFDCAYA